MTLTEWIQAHRRSILFLMAAMAAAGWSVVSACP